jgi:cobaltochelatase CobS
MAMRKGYWLILDEIDFGEAQILSILNGVLEPGGNLNLKEKDHEIVKPHPNFRIFATANTAGCMQDFRGLYQGTNPLNEAFIDRWKVYHVDYLPADQEAKVINGTVERMTMKITPAIVTVANMVRKAHREEQVSCTFSLRRAIDWAQAMVRHKDPVRAAQSTIFSKVSKEDATVIEGLIRRVMLGNKTTEGKK